MDGQLDLLSSLIMYANWFEADDSPEKKFSSISQDIAEL